MVFNTTFNNISVIYRGSQFYRWRKPECTQMVGSFINPLLDETDLVNLMGSSKLVIVEAVGNHSFTSSSPGSQARPILVRLLSPNIQNQ